MPKQHASEHWAITRFEMTRRHDAMKHFIKGSKTENYKKDQKKTKKQFS